jgi:hypothetical protein
MKLYLWPPTPVSVSVPPVQFDQDGSSVGVVEDTANPGNNKPLPTGIYFEKDGVKVPVKEDTGNPSANDPLPVKLSGVTGDVIINAGDLSVAVEATNDSVAIGDAVTGETANVRQNGVTSLWELHVADDAAINLLGDIKLATEALDNAGISTEATLLDVKTAVENIEQVDFATEATLSTLATEATLTSIEADTATLASAINADGNPVTGAGVLIGGEDTSGDFQFARVNTNGELSVTFGAAGFATETTLTALNNKHTADYGASTGAIRTAAQLGNATGAADFGVGADGAQTLRVSANLKRAGNELTYNSGAADANTLRTVLATRHESDNTPLATRLSNGSNWITDTTIANSQKTLAGGANRAIETVSIAMGWDGTTHREILVNTLGRVSVVENKAESNTGTVSQARITVGTSAVRATVSGGAPASSRKKLLIKPTIGNSGAIYFGSSSVTTSNGMQIVGPDRLEFDGASDFYLISDTAGQLVEIVEVV